jgi:hypothetical protein
MIHSTSRRDPGRETVTVPVRQFAHARAGDKGDTCSIALFAYHPDFYDLMVSSITQASVRKQFQHRRPGRIECYLLPRLHGMNLVLHDTLDGGVNESLNLDAHGKSLSFHLLSMQVAVPTELACRLVSPTSITEDRP